METGLRLVDGYQHARLGVGQNREQHQEAQRPIGKTRSEDRLVQVPPSYSEPYSLILCGTKNQFMEVLAKGGLHACINIVLRLFMARIKCVQYMNKVTSIRPQGTFGLWNRGLANWRPSARNQVLIDAKAA